MNILGIVGCFVFELTLLHFFIKAGQCKLFNFSDVICGQATKDTKSLNVKVVGGEPAHPGQFPWVVSLRLTFNNKHFCGGSIIHNRWILTGGHCLCASQFSPFFTPNQIVAYAGFTNMFDPNARKIELDQVKPPKGYSCTKRHHKDVALLRTKVPIEWSPTIQPVCVLESKPETEAIGLIAGWGKLHEKKNEHSMDLQYVNQIVYSDKKCSDVMKPLLKNMFNPKYQMCAGQILGGEDACQGDSGGSLVVEESPNGIYSVAGVISLGIGCGRPDKLGVYTKIAPFVGWMKTVVV